MSSSEFYGFLGTRSSASNDRETVTQFCLTTDLQRARDLLRAKANTSEQSDIHPLTTLGNEETESRSITLFKNLLQRALDTSFAQKELISFTHFASTYIADGMLDALVVQPAIKEATTVEQDAELTIHGLDRESFREAYIAHEQYSHTRKGLAMLPSAALLSSVSAFDSVVTEFFRALLLLRPERYFSAEQTIPLSELTSAESFDRLKEKILEDEIYRLSRGSHDEQVKILETKFDVDIRKHWKRWPEFIEVFERRNLIAHGEKFFTDRYSSICSKAGHKSAETNRGKAVDLPLRYLDDAQDMMLEFSILLLFSVWRKQFKPDEPAAFETISECAYNLIVRKRYRVAERILSFALGLKTTTASEAVRRTMTINLASSYKHQRKPEEATRTLNSMDWSACSERFVICVEALRENVGRVVELMNRVVGNRDLSADNFQEWPLFSFVRKEPAFRERFLEVFGTPMRSESRVETGLERTDAAKSESSPASVDAKTEAERS